MPRGLQGLIEPKTLAIFKTLSQNPNKLYHLHSLAKEAKVPVATTMRIVKRLARSGYTDTVKVGKLTLYKAAKNKQIEVLVKLL